MGDLVFPFVLLRANRPEVRKPGLDEALAGFRRAGEHGNLPSAWVETLWFGSSKIDRE